MKKKEYKPLEKISNIDPDLELLKKLNSRDEAKWKEIEEKFTKWWIVDYTSGLNEIIEWFKQRTIPK